MAASFHAGEYPGTGIFRRNDIDRNSKDRNDKDRRDSDASMDYGKYGDNHYQRGSDHYGGSCHCQYGTQ